MPARPAPTLVSVVIPARDAATTIAAQLDALGLQEPGCAWEIVVVDNGSTDGTGAAAAHAAPAVPFRVVAAPGGRGPGYARNVGAAAAGGELLAFCDADDEVAADWLAAFVEASARADGLVGRLDFERLNAPRLLGLVGVPRRRTSQPNSGPSLRFGVGANGGNLAVWRDAFEAVGGFDETFCGGSEDKDLGYRLTAAGFGLAEAERAVVHVRLRVALTDRVRQSFRRGREDVHLYVRHAAEGYPRRGLASAGRMVLGLLRDVLRLGDATERVWWWARAARLAGRVVGSVRFRTVYL